MGMAPLAVVVSVLDERWAAEEDAFAHSAATVSGPKSKRCLYFLHLDGRPVETQAVAVDGDASRARAGGDRGGVFWDPTAKVVDAPSWAKGGMGAYGMGGMGAYGGYGGVQVAELNAPYYCGANSEISTDYLTEMAACVAAACDNYQYPDGMNDDDDPQWSDWGVLDHATECYS